METYAASLSYAIPGFVLLILVEWGFSRIQGIEINRGFDSISSLSSGMTNTLKEILGLSVVIVSYSWMVGHLAFIKIQSTVWIYILAFIGLDFAYYWSHRFSHVINIFWNRHIIHHSSEEFNLSCALRQSISSIVGVFFFLFIPMAFIGIPAEVVALIAPIHLFAQFWYHTRLIGKMGFLEHVIVTPSHHRVHHAINSEYIDKNYSAIFIIWDKWFGTFQEEKEDVQPVYGVKRQVKTWNPIIINFQHLWLLLKDCWYTRSFWDKIRLWFMPTGWRPADVINRFPVESVEDVYKMKKYRSPCSKSFLTWAWLQLVANLFLMYFMLIRIGSLEFSDIVIYSVFLFLSIFAYTSLMDRHPISLFAESVKFIVGIIILFYWGHWFGIEIFVANGSVWVGMYLILSLLLSFYYQLWENKLTLSDSLQ